MKQLEQHPAAKFIPPMRDEDMARLRESVRAGYDPRLPIYLYEGKVLVGWSRYQACRAEKVEPTFAEYDGDEPIAFVCRNDLPRRHLAVVAILRVMEAVRPALEKEAAERERFGLNRGIPREIPAGANLPQREKSTGRVDEKIAEATGLSKRTVTDYHTVQEKGSDKLKAAVDAEEVSISDAARVARTAPPEKQDAAVEAVRNGQARTATKAVREPGDDTEEEEAARRDNAAARRTNGKPKFNDKELEDAYGALRRALARREDAWGKSPQSGRCVAQLKAFYESWEAWKGETK